MLGWVTFFLLLDSSLAIRTKRDISREKRSDPCSLKKLFHMEKIKKKDGDELSINVSPGMMDRMMIHHLGYDSICNANELLDLERANRIYVTNNQDTFRGRRSVGDMKRQKRAAEETEQPIRVSGVERIHMIERLAVQVDQLQRKIELAAEILATPQIKHDRDMFMMYKQRMKSLLKAKLKLAIKENRIVLDTMEHINISDQFQR